MKKIVCNLNLFDFTQPIYSLDTETGETELLADTSIAGLPAVISAICSETDISDIVLQGSYIYALTVRNDILEHYNMNYSFLKKEINVEVLK